MSAQPLVDIVAGASLALLLTYGLFRLFVARETYFVWIMPLFLVGILAGMSATMGSGGPLALGTFAGLVAGGVVFGRRSWQSHRAHLVKLESFARELGLSFTRNDQSYAIAAATLVDDIGSCVNMLSGDWHGVPLAVFDYQYMDYSDSDAPAMIVLTCAVATLDGPHPQMLIRGHRLREMIMNGFGWKRGQLGDEAFDRSFHVETAEPERAKAILHPRMRQWLLANARGAKVLVDGTTLMLCTGHQTMKQLPEILEQIRALRATFD